MKEETLSFARNRLRLLSLLIICLLLSISAFSQQRLIKGRVLSEQDASPLPGVSIVVKGTTNGVVTDANGRFSLEVPDNAILEISFIGFRAKEIPVADEKTFSILLTPSTTALSQVVCE